MDGPWDPRSTGSGLRERDVLDVVDNVFSRPRGRHTLFPLDQKRIPNRRRVHRRGLSSKFVDKDGPGLLLWDLLMKSKGYPPVGD